MNATQKMDAFGMKALEERTGKNLVTLYRWRRAISDGVGISDSNKRLLIAATANAEQPIALADFYPAELTGEPGSSPPAPDVIDTAELVAFAEAGTLDGERP